MKPYSEMTKEELLELKRDLSDQYREFQGKNLTLQLRRPGRYQRGEGAVSGYDRGSG